MKTEQRNTMAAEKTLYPYQVEGAEFLSKEYHRFLADDMGLGKTAQSIKAMDQVGATTSIVICPATIKINWARQIGAWSEKDRSVYIVKTGADSIPPWADIIIVNYELIVKTEIYKQLIARGKQSPFDFCIIDEARYLKNKTTQRTKKILGFGRRKKENRLMDYARYKWLLDGTPIPNRPIELYPILRALAPEVIRPYTSYEDYGKYFCNGRRQIIHIVCASANEAEVAKRRRHIEQWVAEGYSNHEMGERLGFPIYVRFGDWDFRGASHTDELKERLESFMLRRTKKDVLHQLPDKVETEIELECSPPNTTDDTPVASVRKDLGIAKVPGVLSFVKDTLQQIDKIVVFAYHRDVVEMLVSGLEDYNPVNVYGGLTTEVKQAQIDKFVNDPGCRVFIGQILAGGTGVDGLQLVCNNVIYAERDWSPGNMDQSVDRLHRMGQTDTVFVYHLIVPNSLDTQIELTLKKKRTVIDKLMKGKEQMPIEQSLERIAVALETLASNLGTAPVSVATPAPAPVAEVKEVKKSRAKKTKAEPAKTAKASAGVDEEAVRAAASTFINKAGTDNRDAARNVVKNILENYGADTLHALPQDEYSNFVADLEKGFDHYSGSSEDSALDDL